ncbi:uncharacterized protein LOC104428938 [Eucalyptus grandis]|uniref:uncharacterized protein LOC104428938 n=1 Tax=Eucalyptus grandis TaxID=71139 RepID=UPI00192E7B1B|nr:uncharacterized protein LOC104428938 [Eucalyptus grandis]
MKGLPAITKPSLSTLSMTECIVEFEHDSKDVPELSTTIDIPSSVYQIIISVLACSIQFTSLISLIDDYKGKDLPTFVQKVNMIHHTIKRHYEDYKQKKEEIREYRGCSNYSMPLPIMWSSSRPWFTSRTILSHFTLAQRRPRFNLLTL